MNQNLVKPQDGGQTDFLSRGEFEVLFGGAAGPGKSWALVIDALGLQFKNTPLGRFAIEIPQYRAVLFRRETGQFTKLIDEGKEYYSYFGAEFVQGRRGDPGPSFTFPSGARIFICHMEKELDKENHQGQEYQYVGFDEVTQFTPTQYMYLFSRARSTIPHLFARIRSTTNPTGISLIFFKKRFIQNGKTIYEPGVTHYFQPDLENEIEDNPTGIEVKENSDDWEECIAKYAKTQKNYLPGITTLAKSRVFIPGRLYENKILEEADPGYRFSIMQMGKKYKLALLDGDWDAFGGDFFDDHNPNTMSVEPFYIPDNWQLIGSLDPGWAKACSFGLNAKGPTGAIIRLFTYYEREKAPYEYADEIKRRIEEFPWTYGRKPDMIVAGHDAFPTEKKKIHYSPDELYETAFLKRGLFLTKAKTDRILGWIAWKQVMRQERYFYFKDYNQSLIDEIIAAKHDEKKPEDIKGCGKDQSVMDHALDDQRYAIMALNTPDFKAKPAGPVARPFVEEMESEYTGTSF